MKKHLKVLVLAVVFKQRFLYRLGFLRERQAPGVQL